MPTSSSILFTVFLVLFLVWNSRYIWSLIAAREWAGLFGVLLAVLLVLASLTGGLGVFTQLHDPKISDRFDMVASFWSTIGLPFVLVVKAIGAFAVFLLGLLGKVIPVIGDALKSLLAFIEKSPTFSNAFGGLLSATLTALLFRNWRLPVAAA